MKFLTIFCKKYIVIRKGVTLKEILVPQDYEEKFKEGKLGFKLTKEEEEQMKNSTFSSPVYDVKKIKVEQIKANAFNPNRMDINTMKTLHQSILELGFTLPIVVTENEDKDDKEHPYVLIDGFHRLTALRIFKDLYMREGGTIPCTIVKKNNDKDQEAQKSDRQIWCINHNAIKGTHDVDLMSDIVADLVSSGLSDEEIRKRLGFDKETLLRMKQITGLAALFENKEFSKSWDVFNES